MTPCPRCQGLLYKEVLAYAHASLACMNCGNRIDHTIVANRQMAHPPADSAGDRTYPIPIIVSP